MSTNNLDQIEKKYSDIEKKMASPEVVSDKDKFNSLSKDLAELTPIIEKYRQYKSVKAEMENLRVMLKDKEVREIAESEMKAKEAEEFKLNQELEYMLLPGIPGTTRTSSLR